MEPKTVSSLSSGTLVYICCSIKSPLSWAMAEEEKFRFAETCLQAK